MDPTVAAAFVSGLLDYAASKGCEPSSLLEAAGILPAQLVHWDNRIAIDNYAALYGEAIAALGDPLLSFRFGLDVDLRDLTLVGLIGEASGLPAQALEGFNRFASLMIDAPSTGPRLQLVKERGQTWLVDSLILPSFPAFFEMSFARMLGAARRAGLPNPFSRIELAHRSPGRSQPVEEILGVPVRFGSGRNAAVLDPALMEANWPARPAFLQELSHAQGERLLSELVASKGLAGRLATLAGQRLAQGTPLRVDDACEVLGMSRQTLFRKLKQEGHSPSAVLAEVGFRHARAALQSGASVADVGHQLGYSDRSAFSRAYRRWSGHGPATHRKRSGI